MRGRCKERVGRKRERDGKITSFLEVASEVLLLSFHRGRLDNIYIGQTLTPVDCQLPCSPEINSKVVIHFIRSLYLSIFMMFHFIKQIH